jgi:hypothetical protein
MRLGDAAAAVGVASEGGVAGEQCLGDANAEAVVKSGDPVAGGGLDAAYGEDASVKLQRRKTH